MNVAKVTIAYEQKAYTVHLRTCQINDSLENTMGPGGQIIKTGLDHPVDITGTCTLSTAVYQRLRESFKSTWNENQTAHIRLIQMVPGSLKEPEERVFNKGVIKSLNQIGSITMGGEVECQIALSCREEEGIHDYFTDPLLGF